MYTFKAMAAKTYYHMYCNNKAPRPLYCDYFHVFICKFLKTAYPLNFQLYIKFGLTALKTKYHLHLPIEPYDKHEVLRVFSMWIESCESTNSFILFELIGCFLV